VNNVSYGDNVQFDRLKLLAIKALKSGAEMCSSTRIEWSIQGSCAAPVNIVHFARPEGKGFKFDKRVLVVAPGKPKPLEITIKVPCKRCIRCTAKRKAMWAARAIAEHRLAIGMGCRTWFATLTCSPVYLHNRRSMLRLKWAMKGSDFDAMSQGRQFIELDRVIYRDISKYLKRLRKGRIGERLCPPAEFSFMCVTEAHQSGEPHYHMLIHERYAFEAIRQDALIGANWKGGFTYFKLVSDDPQHAAYCCKYLAKSQARVRASINYGIIGLTGDTTDGSLVEGIEKRSDTEQAERSEVLKGDP
jgi:hypothetical protein